MRNTFLNRAVALEDFSRQQREGRGLVCDWLDRKDKQVFKLFGFAGTGKSSIIMSILTEFSGRVAFGAFTGKAALQMRRSGCSGAQTVHSLIYTPQFERNGSVIYYLNLLDSAGALAQLIVLDEVSMLNTELAEDVLRLGCPVLVLGDPMQLGPTDGESYFMRGEPDYFLTEIQRQDDSSGIIEISRRIREGYDLELGRFGNVNIVPQGTLTVDDVANFDAVIVGRNATKKQFDRRLRTHKGFHSATPEVGERLMCLRNNSKAGIFNGETFTVGALKKTRAKNKVRLGLLSDDTEGLTGPTVTIHKKCFTGNFFDLPPKERRGSTQFDFAYALTCHKAQGSSWSNVGVYDESFCFGRGQERDKWLYTAVTRSESDLTVVKMAA